MPPTTSAALQQSDKAYEKAWDEKPKAFAPCAACKTPDYCKSQGCQAKQQADLKRLEG